MRYGKRTSPDEDSQFMRGTALIGYLRQQGRPVLLQLDYRTDRDADGDFEKIRKLCPDLMVLFTAAPKEPFGRFSQKVIRVVPSRHQEVYGQVLAPYDALFEMCKATKPRMEDQE